jgi:hypothetical protein
MRWIVGGRAVTQSAASASQMGRFETEVLVQEANLSALADLPGRWIDLVHGRRPVKGIVLDRLPRCCSALSYSGQLRTL